MKQIGKYREMRNALFGALCAAAIAGLSTSAAAQSVADKFPDRPIKIIVPFAPGGSTDIIARIIGQKMTEQWSQTVVVETRPGAATVIGTQAAVKSDPDGYTLLLTVSNHATNPSLNDKLPYDGLADFEFVSMVTKIPIIPYTSPKFEPTDLKGLIAHAKAKPGTINFGSAGAGSMTHLVAEMLKLQAGIDMQHVVYRGGTPAMNDVLAGQIPMTFGTVVQALPQYEAGLMRALAVTAEQRYPAIPKVPTFKEQGIDLVASEWYVMLAPAKTPRPVVDKLNAELRRIFAIPNLGDRIASIQLAGSTPDEAREFVKSETARWAPVIKKLGLKAE
ncbi:MAG: tripartite tricarboxylate transporter substrate binding protein [Xanthobacteraceae bacterium]|nr:tripartite tricarboxylate transporter substrate binding protein [Xanthobacteraceae bacterium]